MRDTDAPLDIMCVYDMNVPDAIYKVCLGTQPTQPWSVKHVTFTYHFHVIST